MSGVLPAFEIGINVINGVVYEITLMLFPVIINGLQEFTQDGN